MDHPTGTGSLIVAPLGSAGMRRVSRRLTLAVPTLNAGAKDVVQMLNNVDDPEVDAEVKGYLRSLYSNPGKPADKVEEPMEMTSQVERKYIAAQVVEYGVQVRERLRGWAGPCRFDTPASRACS